jgi:nucleotide-binding universal stress UspA family protein
MNSTADSILVGSDLKQGSESTIQYGASLARSLGFRLVVCHVVEDVPYYPYFPYDKEDNELKIAAIQRLTALHARLELEDTTELRVELGDAAELLEEVAEERSAAAIVVGAAPKSRGEEFLVGSVADSIARVARQPVFFHHPQDAVQMPKLVICALERAEVGRTLETAMAFCRRVGATLHIVHVACCGQG